MKRTKKVASIKRVNDADRLTKAGKVKPIVTKWAREACLAQLQDFDDFETVEDAYKRVIEIIESGCVPDLEETTLLLLFQSGAIE